MGALAQTRCSPPHVAPHHVRAPQPHAVPQGGLGGGWHGAGHASGSWEAEFCTSPLKAQTSFPGLLPDVSPSVTVQDAGQGGPRSRKQFRERDRLALCWGLLGRGEVCDSEGLAAPTAWGGGWNEAADMTGNALGKHLVVPTTKLRLSVPAPGPELCPSLAEPSWLHLRRG